VSFQDDHLYGRLVFPPNTVPPGCTLTVKQQTSQGNFNDGTVVIVITSSNNIDVVSVSDKYENDPCADVSPSSPVWSIQLKGCKNNKLQGGIQMELLGLSSGKEHDTCIGYAMDKEEVPNTQRWNCLSKSKKVCNDRYRYHPASNCTLGGYD